MSQGLVQLRGFSFIFHPFLGEIYQFFCDYSTPLARQCFFCSQRADGLPPQVKQGTR